jgi:FkbM family methyltransferase
MNASFDGFTYILDCPSFMYHINAGSSEPYPRELAIVKDYLARYPSRNNTFIDVGGHIGTISLPYSRLFKTVIAFEPNMSSFNFFKENISLNNCTNVSVTRKGVADKNGFCKIAYHNEVNSGCVYIKDCGKDDENAIEVVKLDDVEHTSPVDFIKIDTEGSELFVLEGARSIISKYHPLICVETNDCSSKFFGYGKERIFEFMESLGYVVLNDDGNNPLFYHP